MIKISLPWIIEAIRALYEVEKIADGSELGQVFGTLYLAQDRTKALLTNSLYSGSISAARQAGNAARRGAAARPAPLQDR